MPNNITQIPAMRVPLIDAKTGLMSREWYLFFINLFTLTGEGSNTSSLSDLQVGPPPVDFAAVNAVFTASTAGLAPASGGGTANFLRADGTFAAPPITAPAGASTEVQFNNAGAFGASANFTYNTGTNTFTVGPAGATTIIETLAPTGATLAGTLRFQGKNASATNGDGGGFEFVSGNGLGTGVGGSFNLLCGLGPAGSGSMLFRTNSFTVIQLTENLTPAPLLGFYGATPVAQAAAYTKTYSTASRVVPVATFTNLVTTAATNVSPFGFTTSAQADAISTKVNALGADVLILKQLIVSLVNDSSKTLGVGLNAT
jgi:hypothetical protein